MQQSKFCFHQLIKVVTVMIITSYLVFGCSSSTESQVGALIGNISLVNDTDDPINDPIDYSGVTVALYDLAVYDTTLTRINVDYPQIGIIASQEAFFDHRLVLPVKSTQSSATGSFSLSSISPGMYNVVISKAGWGTRYYYSINIAEGENSFNVVKKTRTSSFDKNGIVTLFPIRYLTGTIADDYQFLRDHEYNVEHDIVITGNSTLQNGARILISPDKNLTIMGDLSSDNSHGTDYALISSLSYSDEAAYMFNEVQVFGNLTLNKCVIENASNGFRVSNSSSYITECIVRNGKGGFTFIENVGVTVSKSLAYNLYDQVAGLYTSYAGFYTISCTDVNMSHLILMNNNSGVKIKDYTYGQVHNSYFVGNNYGAESYSSETRFHHNAFERSSRYDIRVCGHQLQPTIDYNAISSLNGIMVGLDVNANYINCNPIINYNNISSTGIALHIIGLNSLNPNATNNYFYTTDTAMIEQLIIDRNDYDVSDPTNWVNPNTGYFEYFPYRSTKVATVGIG